MIAKFFINAATLSPGKNELKIAVYLGYYIPAIETFTTNIPNRMPTSIWSGQLCRHLRLSILFHENGCKKFKKYAVKRKFKRNVTTQSRPQSRFFFFFF